MKKSMLLPGLLVLLPFLMGAGGGSDAVTWIFISDELNDVDQLGIQICASASSPEVIDAAENPLTGADGVILRDLGCRSGDRFYFEGMLYGLGPDQREVESSCGWGAVIRRDEAPEGLRLVSDALMLEEQAGRLLAAASGSTPLEDAIDRINRAIQLLDDARQAVRRAERNGDIPPEHSMSVTSLASNTREAIKRDRKARNAIRRAIRDFPDSSGRSEALGHLLAAKLQKQLAVINLLAIYGLL